MHACGQDRRRSTAHVVAANCVRVVVVDILHWRWVARCMLAPTPDGDVQTDLQELHFTDNLLLDVGAVRLTGCGGRVPSCSLVGPRRCR